MKDCHYYLRIPQVWEILVQVVATFVVTYLLIFGCGWYIYVHLMHQQSSLHAVSASFGATITAFLIGSLRMADRRRMQVCQDYFSELSKLNAEILEQLECMADCPERSRDGKTLAIRTALKIKRILSALYPAFGLPQQLPQDNLNALCPVAKPGMDIADGSTSSTRNTQEP